MKLILLKIKELMYVPLIQGTLTYVWETEKGGCSKKTKLKDTIFASAVLPKIYATNQEIMNMIANRIGYNNLIAKVSRLARQWILDFFKMEVVRSKLKTEDDNL